MDGGIQISWNCYALIDRSKGPGLPLIQPCPEVGATSSRSAGTRASRAISPAPAFVPRWTSGPRIRACFRQTSSAMNTSRSRSGRGRLDVRQPIRSISGCAICAPSLQSRFAAPCSRGIRLCSAL
jgi:hypothetical protein